MEKRSHLFTSESVTEGHPDKLADQIADSILDAILKEDPYGRVACETLVTTGLVFVAGEITTDCYVDITKVVRQTVKEVGYTDAAFGFDYKTCAVTVAIDEQSSDISQGVSQALEVRTGVNDDDALDAQGPATRAWCSATPAPRRPSSCRCRSRSHTGLRTGWPTYARPRCSPIFVRTAKLR